MRRLDKELTVRGLASTRSQAENYISLGLVFVDAQQVRRSSQVIRQGQYLEVRLAEKLVSRAGLKLASVAGYFRLNFRGKIVLDVGSSTGGFTDYALRRGAKKVIAVDVGTDQLHSSLREDQRVELYEKTDIRQVVTRGGMTDSPSTNHDQLALIDTPDIILIDVSFISLRLILPHIASRIAGRQTRLVVMVKPQFEAGREQVNKGVIKNDKVRRQVLREFESWTKNVFNILDKRDSSVAGAKGNQERFYMLTVAKNQ